MAMRFLEENPGLLKKMMADTQLFMDPFIKAMEMEGYYQMKKPCYSSDTVNPDSLDCTAGSKFVSMIAHNMMANDK